jgi:hypothetical protein
MPLSATGHIFRNTYTTFLLCRRLPSFLWPQIPRYTTHPLILRPTIIEGAFFFMAGTIPPGNRSRRDSIRCGDCWWCCVYKHHWRFWRLGIVKVHPFGWIHVNLMESTIDFSHFFLRRFLGCWTSQWTLDGNGGIHPVLRPETPNFLYGMQRHFGLVRCFAARRSFGMLTFLITGRESVMSLLLFVVGFWSAV